MLRTFEITYRFANGVHMIYKTDKPYVRFEGTEGGSGSLPQRHHSLHPASVLTSKIGPHEIHFPLKSDKQDFIDAVKNAGRTLEDEEVGQRVTSLCHLGHIAIHLGQKLRWDARQERFLDNDKANTYLDRPIHNLPQA